jgi:ABC-type dipeptide/oligopeptide/nickel transport system permease component
MSFILRRLVFYLVAAWVALTLNFFIPRAMPGNAVEAVMAGFMSLEPHLARGGRFGGFSGPQEFRRAAQALKSLLNELSISYR